MGPGLPGIGVTSIFYVLIGIVAPFREVVLTVRGRSSIARWRLVGRQFSIALSTALAVTLFYLTIEFAIDNHWFADKRTRLPGVLPAWTYGLIALFGLLVTLAIYARCCRRLTVSPQQIARAHSYSVSDRLGVVAEVSEVVIFEPRGRHLVRSQRLPMRPLRSVRQADLAGHLGDGSAHGRHVRGGRHDRTLHQGTVDMGG